MRHLAQVVRNSLGDRASTCINPKTQVVREKTVCIVSCQRSPEPVFLKWKQDRGVAGRRFLCAERPGEREAEPRKRRRVHQDEVSGICEKRYLIGRALYRLDELGTSGD